MRILMAQLAPVLRDVAGNLERLEQIVAASDVDLAIFPELYAIGYLVGDRVHRLALRPTGPEIVRLRELARRCARPLIVGVPLQHGARPGEVENAAVLIDRSGEVRIQAKRFLPTFGPFEEGHFYTPTSTSQPFDLGAHRVGLQICYDAFFPEVSRELALGGADLLVVISASPVTSRVLFDRILPARALENSAPLVYVNRVGVEDGIVFGGGSGAWDSRGAPRPMTHVPFAHREAEERLDVVDLDLAEGSRWRPFRPVLRDVAFASRNSHAHVPGAAPVGADGRDPAASF